MVRQRIPREMQAEVRWTRIFWETQNPDRHDKGRVDRRPFGVRREATVRSDREALGEIPAPALFSAPRFRDQVQFPASPPLPASPAFLTSAAVASSAARSATIGATCVL